MGDWKNKLANFVTGEGSVTNADEWVTANKAYSLFGNSNWMLGQQGTTPYAYIILIRVQVPSGYTKELAAADAAELIHTNIKSSKVTFVSFWNYNLIYGCNSKADADSFLNEIKTAAGEKPSPTSEFDYKLIIIGIAAVALIAWALKKHR